MYKGKISEPSEINIVSSKSISQSVLKMFEDPSFSRNEIINGMQKSLDRIKIKTLSNERDDFQNYLSKQNIAIKFLDIDTIIFDYYNSSFGTVRFQKQEPFRYRISIEKENYDDQKFVSQIKKIYPGKKQNKIISDAKDNYYSCLCLRATDQYLFGNNNEFELAKDDVYQGINMLFYNVTDVQQAFISCLYKATQVKTMSILGDVGLNIINNSDKKGFCHLLVNEGKISWENEHEDN